MVLRCLQDQRVADSDVNATNAWIVTESKGHPIWYRSQLLIACIAKNGDPSGHIRFDWCEEPLSLDDYAALVLMDRHFPGLEIQLVQKQSADPFAEILPARIRRAQQDDQDEELRPLPVGTYGQLTGMSRDQWRQLPSSIQQGSQLPTVLGGLWRHYQLGSIDTPHRVIAALREQGVSDSVTGALYFNEQIMALLTHQNRRVARTPDPSWLAHLPADVQRRCHYIKAYCATLARSTDVAEDYFKRCGIDLAMLPTTTAQVYELNIYALYTFLCSRLEEAETLERRMEHYLDTNGVDEFGIRYVNYINSARLARAQGDYPSSLHYYGRAYALDQSAASESGRLYQAMNYAKIYSAQGDAERALSCWVQSALVWVTMTAPEAIGWRPLCAILNSPHTMLYAAVDCDEIARAYIRELCKCGDAPSLEQWVENANATPGIGHENALFALEDQISALQPLPSRWQTGAFTELYMALREVFSG